MPRNFNPKSIGNCKMNVFAEYLEENKLSFRRNTILQFGESWNLIGNIVLANPGSAEPQRKINTEEELELNSFNNKFRNGDYFNKNRWFKFGADSTMRFVEKIFNGEYVNKNIELNGVIQLFNTFNIKNQNLEEAINQIGVESETLFSVGIEKYFHDKPTYFGFSNEVLDNNVLREVAEKIFNKSSDKIKSMYNNDFSKNSFYHPMYINRAHNQDNFQQYKADVLLPILKMA